MDTEEFTRFALGQSLSGQPGAQPFLCLHHAAQCRHGFNGCQVVFFRISEMVTTAIVVEMEGVTNGL